MTFSRAGDGWQQTSPVSFPLEPQIMDALLVRILEMRVMQTVLDHTPEAPDKIEMELTDQSPSFSILLTGGETVDFLLGRTLLANNAYILNKHSNEIVVVNNTLQQAFIGRPETVYWKRKIQGPKELQIKQIVIQPDQGNSFILRKDQGDWYVGEAGNDPADPNVVEGIFAAVRQIELKPVAVNADASAALLKNRYTISFEYPDAADTKPFAVFIGSPSPTHPDLIRSSISSNNISKNIILDLNKKTVKNIVVNSTQTKDARLFHGFAVSDLLAIELDSKKTGSLAFKRDPLTDQITFSAFDKKADHDFQVDQLTAAGWVKQILSLKARGYLADIKTGSKPIYSIKLQTSSMFATEQAVAFYRVDLGDYEPKWISSGAGGVGVEIDDALVAVKGASNTAYILPNSAQALLEVTPLEFREHFLFNLDRNDLDRITIERNGYDPIVFIKTQSDWQREGVSRFNRLALHKLIATTSPMIAGEWLDAETPEQFAANLIIRLGRTGGEKQIVLKVNTRNNHAICSVRPGVFELTDSFRNAINAIYSGKPKTNNNVGL